MRVYADRALPFVIGALPVIVVVALAFLLVLTPQGVSHGPQQTPAAPAFSLKPAGSNPSISPASSGTSPQPASPGGQGGSGGSSGGFCLPLLGCV
ncbi:MAG TPA: hypothetical protein VGR53_04090 [Nitrososphaerales archaeon]|nr:hypothetical protein [Nitrososphaerales archaeon]